MHELSIAYDLYATARKAAIENHAKYVKQVSVEVGKMAMVNPEQVTFLFGTIKEDDPLFEKTVLVCTEVTPQTTCT
jgi:hydrogenase nickel incorporation protein HypA/HybF